MSALGLKTGVLEKTIVIQGFGNVGRHTAKFFFEAGAKVICLIERDGYIYNEDGINITELLVYEQKHGSILGFDGAITENGDTSKVRGISNPNICCIYIAIRRCVFRVTS